MMTIKRKNLVAILIQIILIFLTVLLKLFMGTGTNNNIEFIFQCRYGLFVSIILFLNLLGQQRKIITGINIFYIVFVLFQFGLPIIYSFIPDYYNYYITLFNNDVLRYSAEFTIFSIQLFVLGLSLSNVLKVKRKSNINFWNVFSDQTNNKKGIENAALILFIACAILVVPVNAYAALTVLKSAGTGMVIGAKYRGIMSGNAILRLVQQLFFPSGILFLCFNDNKGRERLVSIIYLLVVLLMLVVADRTSGISALLVYALYKYDSMGRFPSQVIKKYIYILTAGLSIIFLSVIIAQVRSTGEVSVSNPFFNMIEEMGFNFTSICFVRDYISDASKFKHGLSYIAAVVLLIPKTFDVLKIFPHFSASLGETWLYNTNILKGRSHLSFGVGFSLIAESYYNFGNFGLIIMYIWGIITSLALGEKTYKENNWKKYTRYALLLAFFTLPRRQFSYMLKAIEYNIIFIAIFVIFYLYAAQKGRKKKL